jgi:release factor glutamine methyltransferase
MSDDPTHPEERRIYPFREDSELLRRVAAVGPGLLVLELGCGEGRAALIAARSGARVVATDLNPYALRRLAARVRHEQLPLACVRTDLFAGLRRFDRILVNPPYLPTSAGTRDPDRWVNLALDGGPDGAQFTLRLLREVRGHLRPHGILYLVVSSRQALAPIAEAKARWTKDGGTARTLGGREFERERLELWELQAPAADQVSRST